MRRLLLIALFFSIFSLFGSKLYADPIGIFSSTPGAGWNNFSTPNQDGHPYWDNGTFDLSPCNIGHVLTGTNACDGNIAGGFLNPADLLYWGLPDGSADLNFFLTSLGKVEITYLFSAAALAYIDTVGYNDQSSSDTGVLMVPGQERGDKSEYIVPLIFDLYLYNGTETYRSSGRNTYQHFAVFMDKSTGYMYVGCEDLPSTGTDGDFQDCVIRIKGLDNSINPFPKPPASQVPEPRTDVLVAIGLLSILIAWNNKPRFKRAP